MAVGDYTMQAFCFDGVKCHQIQCRTQKYLKKRENPLSSRSNTKRVLALKGYIKPPVEQSRGGVR